MSRGHRGCLGAPGLLVLGLSLLPPGALSRAWGKDAGEKEAVIFESQVRPILEARCAACHAGPRRKHGLDVRQRQRLVRGGDSGPAIVPGKAAESRLVRRIVAGEMPPGDREKVSAPELQTIQRWIDAGAPTAGEELPLVEAEDAFLTDADREHWAFRPVTRPPVPSVESSERVHTPIDAFILARLEGKGLTLAPEAERATLARRLYLDLHGLPPTPEELERFLADTSAHAYEDLIDRLLESPRFGERWGRHWLDAAGYADSDGYTDEDRPRPDAWRYRDYVIRSLNEDKPFDAFLREQLAGDELAGYPARPLTPETRELLVATGFLRCGADGTGQGGVDAARAQTQAIADAVAILGTSVFGLTLGCAQCHDHRYDPISQRDYHRIRAALEPAFQGARWRTPPERRISLYTEADRQKAAEVAAAVEVKRAERSAREAELIRVVVEKLLAEKLPEGERAAARAAWEKPRGERTPAEVALFDRHPFLNISGGTLYQYDPAAAEELKRLDEGIAQVAATRPPEEFVSALWEIPGEVPPSRLLIRGQPDQPGEEVPPGMVAVLGPPGSDLALAPPEDLERKTTGRRLALAAWLTRPDHPLTARVLVNRIWMHHFGRGLVPTPGDFGQQGDLPTHPELLDWLADELVRGGWRLKRLHRLIVASGVYRQSARALPEMRARAEAVDPEGELCWHRPTLRVEGECVRDSMLAISGALSLRAGGPPVPVKESEDGSIVVGVDQKAPSNLPGADVSLGEEARRRTVYVEVRRSRPLSLTAAFDVPVMETNCPRRSVSVVATQALALLNGPFAREQAELFAGRLEREAPDPAARVGRAFLLAFARPPQAEEALEALQFLTDGIGIARAGAADSIGSEEAAHAALVNLCQVIFNANEFLFVD